MSYANVSVNADASTVEHHCDHDDGVISVRLTRQFDPLTVYLHGTPAQIAAVAYGLLRVVDNMELPMAETATRSTSDLG